MQGFLRLKTNDDFVARMVAARTTPWRWGRGVRLPASWTRGGGWPGAEPCITGCDGLPEGGQRLVREGGLAATVITPSNAGPAVDLIAEGLRTQRPIPAEVTLKPASFPDLGALGPGLLGR